MFNLRPDLHDSIRGFEQLNMLERENAELRHQLAVLQSQSDHVAFEPAGLFYLEARYRALIELSPQVTWMADAAGNVVYTNRYWHQYSGLSYQQTSEQGVISIVHPQDAGHTVRNWRRAVQAGAPFDNEARFRRASDGQYRWHLSRALPLKNAEGHVVRWIGISIDIHDRKMAAAAVAESDERVRIAVDAAGMGTWDYYPEPNQTKWSRRSREIFGLAPDEELNLQGFLQRVHPEDRARVAAKVKEAKDPAIASEYDAEYRIVLPDGAIRWVIARGKCFFAGSGASRKATRFSGVVLDITERKEAERERARLITVVQNSPYFIGVSDLQGNVLFVNQAGRKLVGLPDVAAGKCKKITEYIPAEDEALLQEKILPAIVSGNVWEGETRLMNHQTGAPTLVEVRAFGISDESQRLTGLAMIGRDISDKKRMEAQLALAQKMDAVGKLAGALAHDFGNLLTIIKGYGEVLKDRFQDDAENSRIVTQICSAATTAATLTSQLLAFGRPQMVQPRMVDLTQSVTRLLDMLQRLVGKDIAIETQFGSDLWSVKADPAQVDQIIINLAANARDAMPNGGTISVTTQNCSSNDPHRPRHPLVAGDYVKLCFSDTGMGMDAETLRRIFEPFFTTKEPGKGTGLGLATVHGIMQQIRGQVSVFSERGRGTAFTLYFPRVIDETVNTAPSPEAGHLRGVEQVLLAEDDDSVREMLEKYLRKAGYSVLGARNQEEALRIAQIHAIDLLITNIVMPGGDGRDLAVAARKIRPNMATVFVSARMERDPLQEALQQPRTSFIPKPFSITEMLAAVRRALEERVVFTGKETEAQ